MTPIYVAADTREAEAVERLLDEAAVPYDLTPEASLRSASGVCFQGLLFAVADDDAPRCRALLRARGLGGGIAE